MRNESVRLSLEDDFTSGMARAAAATALFKKELDGLDGKRVSRDLDDTSKSVDRVGASARRSGPEIDKYSGRLRLLTDTAVVLGPALIPLGAAVIPAVTGALAGLGAAAGAVGATILAFDGLGTALKAIDKAHLDPSVENVKAMRIELEKLGPAGAHFAMYLENLRPLLADLKNTARGGIFPGVEDGINVLLSRAPQVERTLADLSTGMGNLAREAGEGLSSEAWTPFFNYVETDARPTLEAFARATGNVAEGIANMFVAFAPLSRDFTGGLEHATEAFARWSEGLGENQGFQEFVAEIRRSGPQAVAFLSAVGQAFLGLIEAAAPVGSAVLPVLTALTRVFALIAKSPIGPALYGATAGLLAFNRAAKIVAATNVELTASFSRLGIVATTTRAKMALLGTAGAAAALGLGTLSDGFSQLDSRSRTSDTIDATVKSLQDLQDTISYSNLGKYAGDLHIDLARLSEDLAANGKNGEYVKQVLDQLGQSSHGFSALLKAEAGGILPFYTDSTTKAYDANKDLNEIIGKLGNGLGATHGMFGPLIDSLGQTVTAAQDLSGALSELNGWFDKRQAVRDYKDSIAGLTKGFKDGFTRADVANIDAVGRSILQVAQDIKSPAARADFLANARGELEKLAKNAGPKAAAAIQDVINKFDDEGLTHPKSIQLSVDDSRVVSGLANTSRKVKTTLDYMSQQQAKPQVTADDSPFARTINGVKQSMRDLASDTSTPTVTANDNPFRQVTQGVRTEMRALDGLTATTYVRTIHTTQIRPGTSTVDPHAAIPGGADGMTVPGKRHPYGDKMLAFLAPGEEVISNRYGQADRFRADRASGRIPGYADGGPVWSSSHHQGHGSNQGNQADDGWVTVLVPGVYSAAKALKAWESELTKSKKTLDKETAKRDDILSSMSALSGSIADKFNVDLGARSSPWAAGNGGLSTTIAQATAQAQAFPGIIAALKSAGLTGPALTEALQEMNYSQLAALAANPSQAGQLETSLTGLYSAQQAAGGAAGQAVYGAQLQVANQELRVQTRELAAIRAEVRELRRDVKQADKNNQAAQDKNAKDVKDGVNGAAGSGHRRGQNGPRGPR